MLQKEDNPILYKCTECKFMVTQYFDTKLYALRTILVNGEEKKPFVIRLGDNLNYVKNIARNINMLNPVYLETEIYKNDRPFLLKEKIILYNVIVMETLVIFSNAQYTV